MHLMICRPLLQTSNGGAGNQQERASQFSRLGVATTVGPLGIPLTTLDGMQIVALSGIASPRSFESELVNLGATVMHHETYPDHHRYNQQEIIDLINDSIERGADAIITTEKDAVRMPRIERRDIPIYYLRVEIEMLSGEEEFYDWINRICFTTTH